MTSAGLTLRARRLGDIAVDDVVEAFVRPEAFDIARQARDLPASAQPYSGTVESLLFDGANSAVLVRETQSRAEFRIALPQTGRLADLSAGETIAFGVAPSRVACFAIRNDVH